MKKHLVMAVLPLLAWGCGDSTDADNDGVADGIRDPNNVSVVVPSTPKGTVSGQVLGTNLQALEGVTVAMTIGSQATGKSATTDASGNFVMTDVPAGAQVLLTFSKSGYATLRATSTVPSAAGTVPINNGNASFGPVTLAQLNGKLVFNVVTPQGRPAAGAKGTLEVDRAGSLVLSNYDTTASVLSKVYVEATADDQGVLTFNGVPSGAELARLNGSYNLWVSPMDANGDGIPETGGFVTSYSGAAIVSTSVTRVVNLPFSRPQNVPLAVEGSNVGSLKAAQVIDPLNNLVRPGEPIYVYFNQPVQAGSLLVRLTDEYAKESLAVTANVNAGGYSATINPGSGVVQEGKEYNLFVRAVSAEGGTNLTQTGFFFGGDQASPKAVTISELRYQETSQTGTLAATQLNPGEVVYVSFSAPLRPPAGTSVQVFFKADINNDTYIGTTAYGEFNNYSGQGFPLVLAEPTFPYVTRTPAETPVFGILQSGYSTRYAFTYGGTVALNPTQTELVVAFSKLPTVGTNEAYESTWGQPVSTDLSAVGIAIQPAQTPPPTP
ncbi:carboxypeptidase regulatory-like domain-containing protein [Corallococcus praedator]|uniref:Carboxypeptidase regulatory-like domain-containing protein n=1 Tax=Corallococcus praedator TaxID=2316724 RepID=A0ABX9QES6_9BACT|nr:MULTISPECIES: carboxypeptidase-like regulatory domain-containing protein [Corallococcus]RKH25872.1 carboxypeptidase regulatory-like domain-containing protein [Corallococcus sp. CA031C]RKI03144.1 carboxypeptidase regulatory-like domain-containing protein [Corallococcus praedator]